MARFWWRVWDSEYVVEMKTVTVYPSRRCTAEDGIGEWDLSGGYAKPFVELLASRFEAGGEGVHPCCYSLKFD